MTIAVSRAALQAVLEPIFDQLQLVRGCNRNNLVVNILEVARFRSILVQFPLYENLSSKALVQERIFGVLLFCW